MRYTNFRTAFRISLLLTLSILFINICDAKIIHKARLVKVVRRESVPEKTRLADGTLFEKYVENGELPPLPIEGEEEEADDLNDPRIGHLDKDGGIAVPVDSEGRVLKGYEYLTKPIILDLDLEAEEDDSIRKLSEDSYQFPNAPQDQGGQKDYKPYPNNGQDLQPKQEFLPGDGETAGDEYDDISDAPREPLPNVPDLPKPDYTDSGESDENLKGGDVDEQEPEGERVDPLRPNIIINEVIIPSSNIELPISRDDVDEKSKSADEVEKETEIERDGDAGEKNVDIPKNRLVGDSDIDETKFLEGFEEDEEVLYNGRDENEIDLSEADVENLAKDLGKSVLENVLNRAHEFDETDSKFETESENSRDEDIDPNSINAQAEVPFVPENGREQVSEPEDLDGVVLPDQSLTDEEIAKIAAESLKPVEPIAPAVVPPRPPVRGGRIGSGVQPDSATQQNIFIQFFIVSLAMLLL